jgi:hypothetical protein
MKPKSIGDARGLEMGNNAHVQRRVGRPKQPVYVDAPTISRKSTRKHVACPSWIVSRPIHCPFSNCLCSRWDWSRSPRWRSRARAHDKGCDGNPVLGRIKLDCCGEAEEHQLRPEQISRGPNDEYIVSFEGYTFVIPADKALPSHDPCSHIFFPNMWVETDGGDQVRDPRTPNIRCFLTLLTTHPGTFRLK